MLALFIAFRKIDRWNRLMIIRNCDFSMSCALSLITLRLADKLAYQFLSVYLKMIRRFSACDIFKLTYFRKFLRERSGFVRPRANDGKIVLFVERAQRITVAVLFFLFANHTISRCSCYCKQRLNDPKYLDRHRKERLILDGSTSIHRQKRRNDSENPDF